MYRDYSEASVSAGMDLIVQPHIQIKKLQASGSYNQCISFYFVPTMCNTKGRRQINNQVINIYKKEAYDKNQQSTLGQEGTHPSLLHKQFFLGQRTQMMPITSALQGSQANGPGEETMVCSCTTKKIKGSVKRQRINVRRHMVHKPDGELNAVLSQFVTQICIYGQDKQRIPLRRT